mmetsp:Transcript_106396/g.185037  ORF Transcript_106396/g.185037 Transcript_106396/m.185037 type:complete len:189 (-) Transcript_106396:100-666(-)
MSAMNAATMSFHDPCQLNGMRNVSGALVHAKVNPGLSHLRQKNHSEIITTLKSCKDSEANASNFSLCASAGALFADLSNKSWLAPRLRKPARRSTARPTEGPSAEAAAAAPDSKDPAHPASVQLRCSLHQALSLGGLADPDAVIDALIFTGKTGLFFIAGYGISTVMAAAQNWEFDLNHAAVVFLTSS